MQPFFKKRLVKKHQKAVILNVIRNYGPISRTDIAKITKLRIATITHLVRELEQESFIREVGQADSTGGRKPVLLKLNPQAAFVIGVDVGASKILVLLLDMEMNIIVKVRKEIKLLREDKNKVIKKIIKSIKEAINSSGVPKGKIKGIGIGVIGPVNKEKGISLRAVHLKGWRDVPLKNLIEKRFGISVSLENDSDAMALGERWFGAGQKIENFVFVNIGIGIENLSYLTIDDPTLIEEIEEYVEYFIIETIKPVLRDIKFDFAHFWEDMAYKTGSLVSLEFVKKYMMPHYKKVVDLLRSNGIDIITLDSDGNIEELIPLWIECGINGVLPNEVAAGMEIVELRKKYGKDLIIEGGIDKRALAKTKKDVEEEVMKKVPYLLSTGGYFPGIDHSVPPDVPFKNYLYYLELVRKLAV